jgi:hypothetical protein
MEGVPAQVGQDPLGESRSGRRGHPVVSKNSNQLCSRVQQVMLVLFADLVRLRIRWGGYGRPAAFTMASCKKMAMAG